MQSPGNFQHGVVGVSLWLTWNPDAAGAHLLCIHRIGSVFVSSSLIIRMAAGLPLQNGTRNPGHLEMETSFLSHTAAAKADSAEAITVHDSFIHS
jgi:hypothetical protein